MPPFLGGGEMIRDVRQDGFTPNEVPWKFEAGTMPIVEAVGLAAAIDYLDGLGMDAVAAHEVALTDYALRALEERFEGRLAIYGPVDVEGRGRRSRSSSRASTPTTSPRSSTSTGSASAPGTTARSP